MNFWKKISKPFFALAPMADVTDPAFRRIVAKYGKPDVLWTEFVSADGLCHPTGREKLLADLLYTEAERPIVAQLFSSNPQNMRTAAKLCAELGFDGIDINMGCPDKTIEKQGCGSAMIKTPDIAALVIQAAKDGIRDAGKDIPLSVKTRVGYNTVEIHTWIPHLLRQNIDALTVHARTRKELSKVPARWEHITEVVRLRDQIAPHTVILGNGDVVDVADGLEKARKTGADGIMIGRAIFGNPWLFSESNKSNTFTEQSFLKNIKSVYHRVLQFFGFKNRYWLRSASLVPLRDRLRVMVEHAYLFEELLPDKSFSIMKKHFKAYTTGFPRSKELRMRLMDTKNAHDVERIVNDFL